MSVYTQLIPIDKILEARENRLVDVKNAVIKSISRYFIDKAQTLESSAVMVSLKLTPESICEILFYPDRKFTPLVKEFWTEIKKHIVRYAPSQGYHLYPSGRSPHYTHIVIRISSD